MPFCLEKRDFDKNGYDVLPALKSGVSSKGGRHISVQFIPALKRRGFLECCYNSAMKERVEIIRASEGVEQVILDEIRLRKVVIYAVDAYQGRKDIFAREVVPPEEPFMKLARAYGREVYGGQEGADRFARDALLLLMTTLYADNSTFQLRRVSNPESFKKFAWLFMPAEVIKRSKEEVVAAAKEYIRPGYNVMALPLWQHNARVIKEKYKGDLINFFAEHDFDAPEILKALIGPARKTDYEGFHRFGQKLGSLFLLWIDAYDLARLERIYEIGIPVDFQVTRLAVQTEALRLPHGAVHKHHVVNTVANSLKRICQESAKERNISPDFISKALWNIGHLCCNSYDHGSCPLRGICTSLISRTPLDKLGLIDPRDVGRFEKPNGQIFLPDPP